MNAVEHVDVAVDVENPIPDLQKLTSYVRPIWTTKNVRFKVFPKGAASGLLNSMVSAFVDGDDENTIVFRTHRNEEYNEFLNREREVFHAKLIHDRFGFAPNVLVTYANGFCYDYVRGEVMTSNAIRAENNWKTIAKQVALMHSVDVEENCRVTARYPVYVAKLPEFYPETLKNPERNKTLREELPTKDVINEEIQRIRDILDGQNSKTVFCHNDLRAENMIWNAETGAVTFVDFETAGMADPAADIAYHFWKYTGVNNNDYSKYPGKDFQTAWLKLYLETYNRATAGSGVVDDVEIERLYVRVNTLYLLFLLQFVCHVVYLEHIGDLPPGFFDSVVPSYREYRRIKDFVLSLKMPS